MKEKINIAKILKKVSEGTKLYCTVYGEVEFVKIFFGFEFPICCKKNDRFYIFTKDGRLNQEGEECLLFPSKDNRYWDSMKPKKPRFDTLTLKPYDKILWRNKENEVWQTGLVEEVVRWCDIFVIGHHYCRFVIPYNEDTKDLENTTNEAPEFYQYWMRYFE